MVGMPKAKDGWVGLWLIPFGLISGTFFTVFWYAVKFGWENLQTGRIVLLLGFSFVGLIVYFVMAGWGARQAVGRVYKGTPIS